MARAKLIDATKRPSVFLAVFLVACAFQLGGCRYGAGDTPEEIAASLVHDVKHGGRAVARAKAYGDRMLEPLRRESRDFTVWEGIWPYLAVDVLSANRSAAAKQLVSELSQREAMLPRLIGLASLAAQGELPGDAEPFLIRVTRGQLTEEEQKDAWGDETGQRSLSVNLIWTYRKLSILALKEKRSEDAVPALVEILKDRESAAVQIEACQALAKIGGAEAAPGLRDAMTRTGFQAPRASIDLRSLAAAAGSGGKRK